MLQPVRNPKGFSYAANRLLSYYKIVSSESAKPAFGGAQAKACATTAGVLGKICLKRFVRKKGTPGKAARCSN
jgi:hypothetical protein